MKRRTENEYRARRFFSRSTHAQVKLKEKGVHARLGELNGVVQKHQRAIQLLEESITEAKYQLVHLRETDPQHHQLKEWRQLHYAMEANKHLISGLRATLAPRIQTLKLWYDKLDQIQLYYYLRDGFMSQDHKRDDGLPVPGKYETEDWTKAVELEKKLLVL